MRVERKAERMEGEVMVTGRRASIVAAVTRFSTRLCRFMLSSR